MSARACLERRAQRAPDAARRAAFREGPERLALPALERAPEVAAPSAGALTP